MWFLDICAALLLLEAWTIGADLLSGVEALERVAEALEDSEELDPNENEEVVS